MTTPKYPNESLHDLSTRHVGGAPVYVARWGSGWEWATIMIDENTGTLAITSSFGNWSFTWGKHALGCPTLHGFLSGTHSDYVASKCIPRDCREVYDFEVTKQALIKDLLLERRLRRVDNFIARERYDELRDWTEDDDRSPSAWSWPDWVDVYESAEKVQTTEDRCFQEVIHPIVVKLAKEYETARIANANMVP